MYSDNSERNPYATVNDWSCYQSKLPIYTYNLKNQLRFLGENPTSSLALIPILFVRDALLHTSS